MYQQLLTNRYLASRIIPLLAVAAVALCVALVIIVVSVMSGFLDMVRASGRTLMGDVVIQRSVQGVPYYDELIKHLEALPEVEAATPLVDTWGLMQMPYPDGPDKQTKTVQIWGIDIDSFSRVTGLKDTLYWVRPSERERTRLDPDDPRRFIDDDTWDQIETDTAALRKTATDRPGALLGIHVSDANIRKRDGWYQLAADRWWMPANDVTIAVLPTGAGLTAGPRYQVRRYGVVNEFVSGVHLIDSTRVMLSLEQVQELTDLQESRLVDPEDLDEFGMPKVIGAYPARATMVLVRGVNGVHPNALQPVVRDAYLEFAERINADPERLAGMPMGRAFGLAIMTWEEMQARFLGPIERERQLMQTLFSIVYVVCAALVLAIFWAIVYEKTRDIGILRSIGASRLGIVGIFLRYGLTIGIIGSLVGFGLGSLIVVNLNHIHHALEEPPLVLALIVLGAGTAAVAVTAIVGMRGDLLPIMLGSLVSMLLLAFGATIMYIRHIGGVTIWDPEVYYFPEIPTTIDMDRAVWIVLGGVVFSLIGAILPAAKAADTDPVAALRYE